TDAAGNSSTTTPISVTIDNAAPAAGTLSSTGLSDTGSSSSDGITQDNTFNLSLSGNGAGSIVYEVSLNGGGWTTTTASQSVLPDGPHQFRATVTDAAGNSSATAPISVTVDNTAPA